MTSRLSRQYRVLVDKGYGVSSGGFRANPFELRGTEIEIEYGEKRDTLEIRKTGNPISTQFSNIANSIQSLQDSGMIHAPTYILINDRGQEPDNLIWHDKFIGLGERLVVKVPAGRYATPSGEYVVDIQNGGIFLPRPDIIRSAATSSILEVSNEDKDLLFGEKCVYLWDGSKLTKIPIQLFGSYEDFHEASLQEKFLESMPVYSVLRRKADIERAQFDRKSLENQCGNPDLVIPSGGGSYALNKILFHNGKPRFDEFTSGDDNYFNKYRNAGLFILVEHTGMSAINPDNSFFRGYTVGISPKDLKVREAFVRTASLESKLD